MNKKDALIADKRLASSNEAPFGMEYAGKLPDGKRVMGITPNGGSVANLIAADKDLMVEIPQNWTLEEASTIPIAYTVALHALKQINNKKHHNILIHCGADGVGQAAIFICTALGLNIFATAANEAKKVLLQKAFPHIEAAQFGCYGDTAFDRFVKRKTKGKGVDVVFNSSTAENPKISLNTLVKQGIYIAINTSSSIDDKSIPEEFLSKEIHFHSVFLDSLFCSDKKYEVMDLLKKGLKDGIVKPLKRTVTYESGLPGAFKTILTGQNFEKMLIKIRPEDRNVKPTSRLISGTARYYPEGSIVITGGLGGFGMELIDWLVSRGATKIVIGSRRITLSGYEASRLR